jgi:hypothetical protein
VGEKFFARLAFPIRQAGHYPIEIDGTGARLRWSPDGSRLASVQKNQIVLYSPDKPQCEKCFSK